MCVSVSVCVCMFPNANLKCSVGCFRMLRIRFQYTRVHIEQAAAAMVECAIHIFLLKRVAPAGGGLKVSQAQYHCAPNDVLVAAAA